VRDYHTHELITDEYGPANSPYEGSRTTNGKVLWYRPHDFLHPNYTLGEELEPGFQMKRDKKFDIDFFEDKRAVYFQRIKKSNFLPRCLREKFSTLMYLEHNWLACPSWDQEPVFDDFY
jgi:hypothetical protein